MVGVYQSIRGDWPPDGLMTAGSGGNGIGLGKKKAPFYNLGNLLDVYG